MLGWFIQESWDVLSAFPPLHPAKLTATPSTASPVPRWAFGALEPPGAGELGIVFNNPLVL